MSDSSDLPARRAEVSRGTKETQVQVQLNLDGAGTGAFDTPVGFLNHMLDLLTRHALIDLTVRASGDTEVDLHHITEDIGICLGQALDEALGEKVGIARFGSAAVPTSASSRRSWSRSSWRALSTMPASRCTSPCRPARTITTLRRPFSRPWRWPCAKPSAATLASPARRARRACSEVSLERFLRSDSPRRAPRTQRTAPGRSAQATSRLHSLRAESRGPIQLAGSPAG